MAQVRNITVLRGIRVGKATETFTEEMLRDLFSIKRDGMKISENVR